MKLSIVVPTVSRPDTLEFCLKTLINQSDKNYEVIVLDNHGGAQNKKIVESLGVPDLIKFYTTKKRLPISESWELAINLSSGDYVTLLGDDDGFVKNGVSLAREAIINSGSEVVCWWPHFYWWNNSPSEIKNGLLFLNKPQKILHPFDNSKSIDSFFKEDSSSWNFERLPSVYNSFVSRKLIERIKIETGDVYFNDICPDIHSGVVNMIFSNSTTLIDWPLTIRGISKHSTGVNDRLNVFNQCSQDETRYSMELVPSNTHAMTIACFKIRKIEKFRSLLGRYKISLPHLINEMLLESDSYGFDNIKQEVLRLCEKYSINTDFLMDLVPSKFIAKKRWGWNQDHLLCINASQLDVNNIYDVQNLVFAVLGE